MKILKKFWLALIIMFSYIGWTYGAVYEYNYDQLEVNSTKIQIDYIHSENLFNVESICLKELFGREDIKELHLIHIGTTILNKLDTKPHCNVFTVNANHKETDK